MTKILGLSGKKQSGKNTTANWIIGQQMCAVDMVSWIKIDERGRLIVPTVVKKELTEGIFDPLSPQPEVQNLLAHYVWPVIKLYSFADILKLSAMAIFGLTHEQVNGTNEQKNESTKFQWKQFKRFILPKTLESMKTVIDWDAYMTSRHILQTMGTDIFRSIYGNVWVDACLKNVKDDGAELAIIIDCRFPNEADGIHAEGGKVLRYLRAPFAGQDEHVSETALDDYDNFDDICDNRELSIKQQNEYTNRLLRKWGYDTWKWFARHDPVLSHTPIKG